MNVKFEKNFRCVSGLPLTLWSINDEPIQQFANRFGKTGLFGRQSLEYFILYDEEYCIGVNMIWHCYATQKDVRNFLNHEFHDEHLSKKMGFVVTLDYLKATIRMDILNLCDKGIPLYYNGSSVTLDRNNMSAFAHFIGIQDLKDSYIACYKQDT